MSADALLTKLELRYGWGALTADEIEARSDDLLKAAASLDGDEVDAVIARIVQTRPYRTMPSPKDVAEAINAVREAAAKVRAPRPVPMARRDIAEAAAVTVLRAAPMAIDAYRDGWFGGLWDFVVGHGRVPVGSGEYGRVRATSLEVRDLADEVLLNPAEYPAASVRMAQALRKRQAINAAKCGLGPDAVDAAA